MKPVATIKRVEIPNATIGELSDTVRNIPNEAYIFDAATLQFIHANGFACRNLGYSAEELIGMTPLEIKPEFTTESFHDLIEPLRSGRPNKIVYKALHQRKDRSTYTVEVQLTMGTDGSRPVFIAVVYDIVDRKFAAAEAGGSDNRFAVAFDHAPIGMALVAFDGRLLKVNQAICKILGYPEQALLGKTLQDITDPKEHDIHIDHLNQMLSGKIRTSHMEMKFKHKLGKDLYVLTIMSLVRDEQDKPLYFISQIQDIGERINAELALQQSEERYRLLIENAPICIHEIDMNGYLVSMNKAGLVMMGTEKEEAVCGVHYLNVVADEDVEHVKVLLKSAYAGTPSFFEYKVKTGSGVRYFDSCFIPIKNRAGSVEKLMGVTQDFTGRKQLETDRLALERQMLHAQKLESLGILAGGIAHDFNNLLTSILGYADLAGTEVDPDTVAREYINEVVRGTRRAAELTQQMLAYSGKGRFVTQPLNITALVQEMSRLLKVSISKKCVLKTDFAADLPIIEADATQVHQIIMNLIINASDSIGDQSGIITISTGIMECGKSYLSQTSFDDDLSIGQYIFLEVTDTGCGISADVQHKIFDPFFTTKTSGYGLGLAAVLGIVRGHKGTIHLTSEMGEGTSFRVLFPVSDQPAAVDGTEEAETPAWQGKGVVLLVDDEASIRKLARIMMKKMGFTVLTASDGREGVDVFRREAGKIDLVVLDMTMPYLNGEEAFREMRRIRPDVRTILSSGYSRNNASSRSTAKGLAGFIQKPYRFDELQAVVRKVMDI
ncbi:MAG: PAS domain S-box protein [Desulfobacteraceae bacterium]|nr:PAS domain S-box protein [Desulfobacteraceae bacterium]